MPRRIVSVTPSSPLGRYERRQVLGTGSFATVWLAHDPVTGLDVALKVLADNWSRDQQVRERFIREARVLLQAESPHIIRVHHVAEQDDQPYMVMAYAAGGTLLERMTDRRRSGQGFTLEETLSIGRDVARGIAATHALGHLHRDIKPANILLHQDTHDSTSERIVLGDFGLARAIDDTAVTMIAGSPGYVAPEQASGLDQLDERADLYPLGLIVTELLCGSSPFVSTSMKAAAAQEEISIREYVEEQGTELPVWLEPMLNSLLHPEAAGRPGSANEVAEFFDARLRGGSPAMPPRSGTPSLTGEPPRRRTVVALGGVGVVALAAGGLWWALGQGDDPATFNSAPVPITQAETDETGPALSEDGAPASTISVAASLAESIPLPRNSRIDQFESEDGVLVVANVALSVDEVVEFYRAEQPGSWEILTVAETEEGATVEIANTQSVVNATLRLSPTALSSNSSITRIETRFS